MKRWLIIAVICLFSLFPVVKTSAMALNPTSHVMFLGKKTTKKKKSSNKAEEEKIKAKEDKKRKEEEEKKQKEEAEKSAESMPVNNAIMDNGSIAPDMTHSDTKNPASVFTETFNDFLSEYKTIIMGMAGLIDLLLIGVVIFRIIRLGSVSQSPTERKNALTALGISLLAVAFMGSVTLWYGLFYMAAK